MPANNINRRATLKGLAAWAAGMSLAPVARAATDALVQISDKSPAHRIRAGLFGANLQWEHSGDGAWVDQQPLPGLVEAIVAPGLSQLRFPGGELANRYAWKSGIGPQSLRPPGLNYAWQTEASTFGTDELIALCRQCGTTPVITVNPNDNPWDPSFDAAQDAADWVDYLNSGVNTTWGARRAANGQASPLRTLWWEVGNESFSPNSPGFKGAADYARRYLRFRSAMRARDPAIKVGLVLEASFLSASWMQYVYPHVVSWNDDVLAVAGRDADFAVLHFYTPFDKVADSAEMGRIVMAGSEAFAGNIEAVQQTLARHGRAGMPMLLTEFGLNFADAEVPSARIAGTENALFVAAMLVRMMAVPDLYGAQIWSLINNSVWGALSSDGAGLQRRPVYDALALVAEMAGLRWLPVEVQGPVFGVNGIGNVPSNDHVPALLAAAGVAGHGALKLLLVNRADSDAVTATLATNGRYRVLAARQLVGGAGPAPSWTGSGDLALTTAADGSLRCELPPATIAMVDLWPQN
jgi:alpha-N-arabinofuranosidase